MPVNSERLDNAPSARTQLKRKFQRGHYDAQTIAEILDAMPFCSVGYVFDGSPYVTPTMQWREGDYVYWHGSSASRMLRAVDRAEICLTVSIVDAMIVARSGFNHSVNSRSVMAFGEARKVTDPAKKARHLERFVDGVFANRWTTLRPATTKEIKATTIMELSLDEASAKIRNTGVADDEADYELPIWAGIVPVEMRVGAPQPDPRNHPGLEVPDGVRNFRFG